MSDAERNGKFPMPFAGADAGTAGTGSIGAVDYLQSVYRDPLQPTSVRLRAASDAAQYERPKLTAVGFVRELDTFASRLERAMARSDPKGEYYARFDRAKMIEGEAVELRQEPEGDPRE